jgi:hypothetical protein
MSLTIIIIDKAGELKTLNVKNYCEQELYKKCGFKKDTNFTLQTTWNVSLNDVIYDVSMYGKTDGKKNFENTNKFPYPINNKTFYGSCALVASSGENKINLSIDLWNQIHSKIIETNGINSYSFVNSSQSQTQTTSKMKKEKTQKKETEKEKENERDVERQIVNETSISFQDFELKEDTYYYSSDEDLIE